MQDARELKKPFSIGEAGIVAGNAAECRVNLEQRAGLLTAKAQALFQRGGVGYLFWDYTGNPATLPCSHDIPPDDPLFGRFDDIAGAIPPAR
jgi:hypothetical protein